jgi:hypothetical protein
MNELPAPRSRPDGFKRDKRFVNHNAMESRVSASQMAGYRESYGRSVAARR